MASERRGLPLPPFWQRFSINSLLVSLESLPISAENQLSKILSFLIACYVPEATGENIFQKSLGKHYAGVVACQCHWRTLCWWPRVKSSKFTASDGISCRFLQTTTISRRRPAISLPKFLIGQPFISISSSSTFPQMHLSKINIPSIGLCGQLLCLIQKRAFLGKWPKSLQLQLPSFYSAAAI